MVTPLWPVVRFTLSCDFIVVISAALPTEDGHFCSSTLLRDMFHWQNVLLVVFFVFCI